jgi:maltooligosyltrehalose synthase
LPFGKAVWEDTLLLLPGGQTEDSYRNVFTGEIVTPWRGGDAPIGLALADIFASFPVALLECVR